jgi:hypothetical protein
MNQRIFQFAAVLALAVAPATRAAEEGFKPLFNGKDLTGWVTPENTGLFSVEEGEIVGRSKKGELKKNEFLVTEKSYGDFILKAKVKIRNHNSGIQFRSIRKENGAVNGLQADIADDYWGSLYKEGPGGAILSRYPKEKIAALVHKDDWNEFEITAKGQHVIIKLNGTLVVDMTDEKFDKTGIIALQLHAGDPMEVRFKDIEIKPLND